MLSEMIINVMLVMFPIFIYFVFCSCNILVNRVYSKLLLIITLLTSLYFSLTYSSFLDYKILLFCNIPILIAYIRKERGLAIVLSIIMLIVSYDLYSINIILVCMKYTLYFILYTLLVNRKEFNNYFLILVVIIQGFFLIWEDHIIELIMVYFMIYILTFLSIYIFNLADRITNLYKDMQVYVNQEKIKNSLFKLTHEIKNPIAVCKGYLDMLDLDNDEKVHRYIPIIKSEIERSLNIMTDYMEYSRIKLNINVLDLTMLLDDLYDSFNVLLVNKSIKFNYINKYDELYINGDYDRLKQVFVNIIKNSVEAINNNGLITMNVDLVKDRVIIKIADNGIGINMENMNHIKEMFYTTKKDGTGLGVSLSDEIISLHGGVLEYDSMENVGTTCTISLPLVGM